MPYDDEFDEIHGDASEAEKLSPEEHYFWVDRTFLHFLRNILSKKAILLYLLYARSCNPKQMQCSMVSYTSAQKCVGLSHHAFDAARQELIDKNLIKLRPDIKTGYFKVIAVEVLPMPSPGTGSLTPPEHIRSIEKAENSAILLPSQLLDESKLKNLMVLELLMLVFLYANCRWGECLGIDFQVVHAFNFSIPEGLVYTKKVFGEGFHHSLQGKPCYQVLKSQRWRVSEALLSSYGKNIGETLNSLVKKELFYAVPAMVRTDPEDRDIGEVVHEVFPGLVRFQGEGENYKRKYRLGPIDLDGGERVVWILRPVYCVNNQGYLIYEVFRAMRQKEAEEFYAASSY